ncbi:hypothetical protein [Facklamia lactis]|uniref:hypothetical protein n=1 Tax=Facklamia lactis TaxID=2749967 RepID=UPI0018CE0841|nr:hypothetical protein [Facklamia lactis]MBG9979443.1 hypothetical protein [Facklamia lactis]
MISTILTLFFLGIGLFSIITNGFYSISSEGIRYARIQHKELPQDVTDLNIKIKVICMFISGLFLTLCGVSRMIGYSSHASISLITMSLFSVYSVFEALYYMYWRTFGFMSISIVLFLFIFLGY